MKKSQGITINTIILVSAGVLILAVLSAIIVGHTGQSNKTVNSQVTQKVDCDKMLSKVNAAGSWTSYLKEYHADSKEITRAKVCYRSYGGVYTKPKDLLTNSLSGTTG